MKPKPKDGFDAVEQALEKSRAEISRLKRRVAALERRLDRAEKVASTDAIGFIVHDQHLEEGL